MTASGIKLTCNLTVRLLKQFQIVLMISAIVYLSIPQVDQKLVKSFSDQIFLTGFVHADPHPGNGIKFSCPFVVLLLFMTHTQNYKTKLLLSGTGRVFLAEK